MRPARSCLSVLALCAAAATAAEDAPGRAVTAATLGELAVAIERSAPAEVHALASTHVAARLNAEIVSIAVEVGDRVEAGAELARLECTDYRDALEQAEASLDEFESRLRLADIRLARTRKLREQNAVSADQLDEADAERAALRASVRAQRTRVAVARRDVQRCTVDAPFGGLVLERPGEPGAFAQPGTPLVELVARDRIELRARLTAADAATLGPAPRAVFSTGNARFRVEPVAVVEAADSVARTRLARLRFTGALPIPGAAGRLRWTAHVRAVPADLLVRRGGELGVFELADGRARFRPLAGAVEGRPAATDLPADTRLIVEGRHGVTDGDAVRVVE